MLTSEILVVASTLNTQFKKLRSAALILFKTFKIYIIYLYFNEYNYFQSDQCYLELHNNTFFKFNFVIVQTNRAKFLSLAV